MATRPRSAPSSPSADFLGGPIRKGRRVNFPTDDLIVSSYCDAPVPQTPEKEKDCPSHAYKAACAKQGVQPLTQVVKVMEEFSPGDSKDHCLDLTGQELSPAHCETLEEVFKRIHFQSIVLEDCGLTDEGAAAIFDMVEYYECADSLSIANNPRIEKRGWQACCKMLKKCPGLRHMDARCTTLNEQTLLILGRALRTSSFLVTLNLEHCRLGGRALVILVAALKLNPSLKELCLASCGLRESDGVQLSTLLRDGRLRRLDVRHNVLGDAGVIKMVEGLCAGPALLASLGLRDNGLGPAVLPAISRVLESTALECLDLGSNPLTNTGLAHLKRSLKSNHHLQKLDLRNCEITCEGAVELAEMLADNAHLVCLDLRGNNVLSTGLTALATVAASHPRLCALNLDSSECEEQVICQELLDKIQGSCDKNELIRKEQEERDAQEPPPAPLPPPTVTEPTTPPSPRSRFQVSRVTLDPAINGTPAKPCLTDSGAKKSKSTGKKLGFLVPELPSSPHRVRKDRRMSTPAVPISGSANQRRLTLNLKFCKRLESLDLRSSVPLSPTRLLEAWEFPEPPNLPDNFKG